MEEAYIVAYGRSPIGKGRQGGAYYYERPEDIAAQVLKGVIARVGSSFESQMIEDIVVGCSIPENMQGMNIGRRIALRAGLSEQIPGQTVNRFCASGLQAIAIASNAIMAKQADILVAGGVEFLSTTTFNNPEMTNNLFLEENGRHLSTSMGLTAENLAEKYCISQADQDQFAVESHRKAYHAQVNGRFEDEIIPVQVKNVKFHEGRPYVTEMTFKEDQGIRSDTNRDQLKKLPNVFKQGGTVTAATSSQISDGASFVVLMSSSKAKELGIQPIAKFMGYKVVGVEPDMMGIGPAYAIPKVLDLVGLNIEDIDLIELNEAFAAQALAVIKHLGLNQNIINPNGGAIALGHPNGATGSILTARLLAEMRKQSQSKYGMVTMCIGGGMGAAAVFEYIRHKSDLNGAYDRG
ncbi:thiolase family protein [Facklamia sp. DSM 111018]|uniref:acetyl-CoA C-acyltransferase n=1 Tax=Facklamia lactis TaxID=2749967 RepID=A0ABS0LRM0_9LACT|nr:thiolase family protein [Facklamia lactis]MBG9980827.1 thiolase family protein [Facklamia lactis]MBG9986810.1 thiolase family protein [Facklamia lactis]